MYMLWIFAGAGVFGALYISDEFDQERALFYGFFLIPTFIFFTYSYFLERSFWEERPALFRFCWGFLLFSFLWGNYLLLNSLVQQPVVIGKILRNEITDHALMGAYKKGSLGHLYRFRF